MPWLLNAQQVLASLEVLDSPRRRLRGLLGRDAVDGAVMLIPAKSVHTVGLKFPIDVLYCRRAPADGREPETAGRERWEVIEVVTMARHRVGRPRWRAHVVIEMAAGSCHRFGVSAGDVLCVESERTRR